MTTKTQLIKSSRSTTFWRQCRILNNWCCATIHQIIWWYH